MFRTLLATVVFLGACVRSSSESCPDGRICPDGTVCRTVTNNNPLAPASEDLCVPPGDVEICAGVAQGGDCTVDPMNPRACYDGVCLPSGCGNLRIDESEVCDDANAAVGDGCSHSCTSNETCGNGLVDPVTLVGGKPVVDEICDDHNQLAYDGCTSACRPEAVAWANVTIGTFDPPRSHTVVVFDAARRQFVMFGGEPSTSTFVGDTWISDGAGWERASPIGTPAPRSGHAMAYDAARRQVVMFGGIGGLADTWLWDGHNWTNVDPPVSPPGRSSAAMTYDSARQRVVLFGGSAGGNRYNDTWEWDGETWSEVSIAAPPPARTTHSLAYDARRGRVVMAGGTADGDTGTETWEYDGATWTMAGVAPFAISIDGMAFDAVSQHVIAYDGDQTGLITYRWTGSAWTSFGPASGGPGQREYFALATDPVRGRVRLVGGAASNAKLADAWEWDGASWSEVPVLAPQPLSGAAFAHDPVHRRIIVFGGTGPFENANDTWELVGTEWLHRAGTSADPPARHGAAMAYDAKRDQLVLFGGELGALYADTWIRSETAMGPVWALRGDGQPGARVFAAMAYDRIRDRVVLFGGRTVLGSPATALDDTWLWDGTTWTKATPTGALPPARSSHRLVYDPVAGRVVMFGGLGTAQVLSDAWEWDGTQWIERTSITLPPPREGHGLAWHPMRRAFVIFAGAGNSVTNVTNDTWEWSDGDWSPVATPFQPAQRAELVLSMDLEGAGILAFAGGNISSRLFRVAGGLADIWRLRYQGATRYEICTENFDNDGDGLVGCDDRDCWARCTPLCEPHVIIGDCRLDQPRCGDGVCAPERENCRNCSQDCLCAPVCGDFYCDIGETEAMCPGDCTPPPMPPSP